MNKERIEQLAQAIEKAPYVYEPEYGQDTDWARGGENMMPRNFNMGYYARQTRDECDTVGCIAGFCVALFPPHTDLQYTTAVAHALHVGYDVARCLCTPEFGKDLAVHLSLGKVLPEQAAQAVRNLNSLGQGDDFPSAITKKLWGHLIKGEDE